MQKTARTPLSTELSRLEAAAADASVEMVLQMVMQAAAVAAVAHGTKQEQQTLAELARHRKEQTAEPVSQEMEIQLQEGLAVAAGQDRPAAPPQLMVQAGAEQAFPSELPEQQSYTPEGAMARQVVRTLQAHRVWTDAGMAETQHE